MRKLDVKSVFVRVVNSCVLSSWLTEDMPHLHYKDGRAITPPNGYNA